MYFIKFTLGYENEAGNKEAGIWTGKYFHDVVVMCIAPPPPLHLHKCNFELVCKREHKWVNMYWCQCKYLHIWTCVPLCVCLSEETPSVAYNFLWCICLSAHVRVWWISQVYGIKAQPMQTLNVQYRDSLPPFCNVIVFFFCISLFCCFATFQGLYLSIVMLYKDGNTQFSLIRLLVVYNCVQLQ